jgi:hypothetical protein
MPSAEPNNLIMKTPSLLSLLLLVGCSSPLGDRSFVSEKTPAAAALSGQSAGEVALEDRVRAANEKNDQRLLKGDWRAAKPAVGPQQ